MNGNGKEEEEMAMGVVEFDGSASFGSIQNASKWIFERPRRWGWWLWTVRRVLDRSKTHRN